MANLFSQAAAYRRKHPNVSQAEAVQICAKKNKTGKKSVGRVRRKKAAAKKAPAKKAAPRKVKVKVKAGKKGVTRVTIGKAKKKNVVKAIMKDLGISGLSHTKIGQELQHVRSLESALSKHRELLKQKGLKATEKAAIRRDITKYRNNIAAAKKHISALKRSL